MRGQGLRGIPGHGLHQGSLVPAPGHGHADRTAALLAQPYREDLDLSVLRKGRDQDASGHVGIRLGVHLGQQRGDELRLIGVVDTFHDEAALTTDPAVTDVEDAHAGLELVACEPDDIGIGAVGQDNSIALEHPLQGIEVIAQARCTLVVQIRRGGVHLLGTGAHEGSGVPGHEGTEVVDDRAVLLGRDLPGAGRCALVDVAEQAGPSRGLGAAEHPAGAGAHREHPEQLVDGLADRPRVGERAEVAHAGPLLAAHHHRAGELLADGHREERVGLVVAVADVEPGVELLDPGVLKRQGLDLGGHHHPVQGPRRGHHRLGPLMQGGRVLEVGREPCAEVLGLAHVDDPAVTVAETVDAWVGGDLPGGGAEAGCHLRPGRSPHPRPGSARAPGRWARAPPCDRRCWRRRCCRGSCTGWCSPAPQRPGSPRAGNGR